MNGRSILSWFSSGLRSVDEHSKFLRSKSGNHHVRDAMGHISYKPHLIQEREILSLVNRKGFGRFFTRFDDVTENELRDIIKEQRSYMSSSKTISVDYSRVVQACIRVSSKLASQGVGLLRPWDVDTSAASLNLRASAGYPYFKKKGSVVDSLVSDYHRISLNELRTYPTCIAFRVSLGRKNGAVARKMRCIYPYPGVITLHELRFVNSFMESILPANTFYATGLNGQKISDRIIEGGSKFDYNYSTDISKFDLNMPTSLLVAAFSVLRSSFNLSKSDIEAFDFVRDYFCSSYFCSRVGRDKGDNYLKISGLPSGSGFTNIIGTISHAIMLEYYQPGFLSENLCHICSDDILFFSNYIYTARDIDNIYNPWGMKVNSGESQFNRDISNIFFLGFNWVKGFAMWIRA